MKKDYYKILEVPEDASYLEIKKSYYKLAKKYHPDNTNSNNFYIFQQKMILINEAYEIISDPKKRTIYNSTLKKDKKHKKIFFWK